MNHKTITLLKNYLCNDTDFQYAFFNHFPESNKFDYYQEIESFIDSMQHDSNLDFYLLDKKYLDISWIQLNGEIINGDNLFQDWKNYIES